METPHTITADIVTADHRDTPINLLTPTPSLRHIPARSVSVVSLTRVLVRFNLISDGSPNETAQGKEWEAVAQEML